MFGVEHKASKQQRNDFFSAAARRFALDAKMLRCRASVHVENKEDIIFWEAVLKHSLPKEKFHFISGSRNEFGNNTSGVTQCLKYLKFLSSSFIICVDSDYRYLLRAKDLNASHFVLQTYTYSFENHHCYADCLEEVCRRVTLENSCYFNFRLFWKSYSNALYGLFVWHLYLMAAGSIDFPQCEFNKYLDLSEYGPSKYLAENPERILEELRSRTSARVRDFESRFPEAGIQQFSLELEQLGVFPDNVYLFTRGHNIYDLTLDLCKAVCRKMLSSSKHPRRCFEDIDQTLRRTLCFDSYPQIEHISYDIARLFGTDSR